MNIGDVLSTNARVKILREILPKTGEIGVSKVAKETRLSKGMVSQYFDLLMSQRILTKRKRKFFLRNNNNVKALRLLLIMDDLDERLFNRYKFVESAGLYGNCSKGENTEESDIDLWVKIKKATQEELALMAGRLNHRFGNVKILILTDEKLQEIKRKNAMFYNSLHFGSIIIYGEKI